MTAGRSMNFHNGPCVDVDGQAVPLGIAMRAVMRKRGWLHVVLKTTVGEAVVSDVHGGGRVVLLLVPPRKG